MNEEFINRSSILELATYMIADEKPQFKSGKTLKLVLEELKGKSAYKQYIEIINNAIIADPSIGEIQILNKSYDNNYSSPLGAVCFQDGDDVYVQYRGTPNGGWVQNSISFGSDINEANAADGVSSQIQADGLEFFNDCVKDYAGHGFSGNLIVGGHSQGGNVAEYVTVMSEHSSLIDTCVSLDGPNHSKELYDYILKHKGADYLAEISQKIIAINGSNDYVNMLGQVSFASEENTFYLNTIEANDFKAWHDEGFMFDSETGRLYPMFDESGNKVEQGPVGQMMNEIIASVKNLPQEQQEDCAKALMALLEMTLGSKKWEDVRKIGFNADNLGELLISEEFVGFMAHGFPALINEVINNPALLAQVLNEAIPDNIKSAIKDFIINTPAPVVIAALSMAAVIAGAAVILGTAVVGIYKIADFIITTVQSLKNAGDKIYQTIISICNTIKNGVTNIAKWFQDTFNAGIRFAADNPYIKVDTAKLRNYAARISNVNSRLRSLDRNLDGLYWQVGLLDIWDILMANLITSGSPTLNQVRSYLDNAADRFDTAENKARRIMGG